MNGLFIVTSTKDLSRFVNQSDRDFFSVPVEVVPHHTRLATRMLYVESPLQGGVIYPVLKTSLKRGYSLTNRQRASARTI